MTLVQTRCLKCGTVFVPARMPVNFCSCCYADAHYLRPVAESNERAESTSQTSETAAS